MVEIEINITGTEKVISNILKQFEQKELEAYDIFNFYARQIMLYFLQVQGNASKGTKGAFWTNRTYDAAKSFLANAFVERGVIGLKISYPDKLHYAKYLEYYHDKRFAAFPTIIDKYWDAIITDIKRLYGDQSGA